VVLMLRGDLGSGALYTVTAALAQGRPVLAVPGDPSQPKSAGCNLVLHNGHARACLSASDLRAALGLPVRTPQPATNAYVPAEALTEVARSALAALSRQACDLEAVQVKTGLDAVTASTALSELELLGLVLQLPGRLYERV
jgi:DNA processing protein